MLSAKEARTRHDHISGLVARFKEKEPILSQQKREESIIWLFPFLAKRPAYEATKQFILMYKPLGLFIGIKRKEYEQIKLSIIGMPTFFGAVPETILWTVRSIADNLENFEDEFGISRSTGDSVFDIMASATEEKESELFATKDDIISINMALYGTMNAPPNGFAKKITFSRG